MVDFTFVRQSIGVVFFTCLSLNALAQETEMPSEEQSPQIMPEGAESAPAEETPPATVADTGRPWRVGPAANLILVAPSIGGGLEFTWDKTFSGGFHIGSYSQKTDNVEVNLSDWQIMGRWHPWMGSFFVGLGYRSQDLSGKAVDDIETTLGTKVKTTIEAGVDSTYFVPHIGWMAVWDSGFTLGFEIGYQMNSTAKAQKLKVDPIDPAIQASEDYKKLEKDTNDAMEAIGKKSIPYLNLLKIGYLF